MTRAILNLILVRISVSIVIGGHSTVSTYNSADKAFLKYISRHVKRKKWEQLAIRDVNGRLCNYINTLCCIMFIHPIHADHVINT